MATRSQSLSRAPLGGDDDPRRSTTLLLLGVILVVATALRLLDLGAGLWLDEILTYVNYARAPFWESMLTFDSQNQHLFYTLLVHGAFGLFGESGWALRLPAVLFGVASIWALFRFATEVTSRREALLASALLALAYHHVWFSQNARGYTGLLFWTLISGRYLLLALRENRRRDWLLYAISAGLGVYTHMTMLFVIAGHFITYLSAQWRGWGAARAGRVEGFTVGFVGAGVATLLLHAPVLPQILFGEAISEASSVPAWTNPLWTLLEFARGLEIGLAGGVVALAALVVFGIGAASYLRREWIVVELLVIPSVISAVVVIATGHHLWPRFFFFAMGFGVLVAVRGTMRAGQWAGTLLGLSPRRALYLGTGVTLAMILVSTLSVPRAYGPKQDFEGALRFVEAEAAPGDRIVAVGLAIFPYTELYSERVVGVESADALTAARSEPGATWLFYTLPDHLEAVHPDILAEIERDFEPTAQFPGTLGGGTVFVVRADN